MSSNCSALPPNSSSLAFLSSSSTNRSAYACGGRGQSSQRSVGGGHFPQTHRSWDRKEEHRQLVSLEKRQGRRMCQRRGECETLVRSVVSPARDATCCCCRLNTTNSTTLYIYMQGRKRLRDNIEQDTFCATFSSHASRNTSVI